MSPKQARSDTLPTCRTQPRRGTWCGNRLRPAADHPGRYFCTKCGCRWDESELKILRQADAADRAAAKAKEDARKPRGQAPIYLDSLQDKP